MEPPSHLIVHRTDDSLRFELSPHMGERPAPSLKVTGGLVLVGLPLLALNIGLFAFDRLFFLLLFLIGTGLLAVNTWFHQLRIQSHQGVRIAIELGPTAVRVRWKENGALSAAEEVPYSEIASIRMRARPDGGKKLRLLGAEDRQLLAIPIRVGELEVGQWLATELAERGPGASARTA